MSDAIVKTEGVAELMRRGTDVAGAVREFALSPAGHVNISGKRFPRVETWMAVANCYGYTGSSRDVERTETGFKAVGEVRRLSDGVVVATAEGFIGEDEPVWFGGTDAKGKTHPRRPEFAVRAMCQTRAISRACRSSFAFVIPLIDAGMATTPAEEMEAVEGVVVEARHVAPPPTPRPNPSSAAAFNASVPGANGRQVAKFGKLKGQPPSAMSDSDIQWYMGASQRSLADPAKARFHDAERAWLAALQAEIAARSGGSDEPPPPGDEDFRDSQ
jgi:hypothetical protein